MNVLTLLDIFGAGFSLLTTYYIVKVDFKAWPLGIIATSMNAILFYHKGIYAEMGLESFYFCSMFYGWYQWQKGADQNNELIIETLSRSQLMASSLFAIVAISTLTYFLKNTLHSTIALWDATTTSLSLLGQWMVCNRIYQNFLIWLFVDVIYIFMYFDKAVPFHSAMAIIYLVMAGTGFWRWRQMYIHQQREILTKKFILNA